MTEREFVRSIWECSDCYDQRMDIETAIIDLENFRADGYDVPDSLTPESYMSIWNSLIDEQEGWK